MSARMAGPVESFVMSEWMRKWSEVYQRKHRENQVPPALSAVDAEVERYFALKTRRPLPEKPPVNRVPSWMRRKAAT
jgi:hypothetical protein